MVSTKYTEVIPEPSLFSVSSVSSVRNRGSLFYSVPLSAKQFFDFGSRFAQTIPFNSSGFSQGRCPTFTQMTVSCSTYGVCWLR